MLVIGMRLGSDIRHHLDNKVLDSYKEVVTECKALMEGLGVQETDSDEEMQKRANRWI